MVQVVDNAEFKRHRTYNFPNPATGEVVTKDLIEHPDGLYINLPNLDYLNDWALSYSAFKTLLSSPPDWHWESPFNLLDDKTETDSAAKRFGSALHCALLERTPEDQGVLPEAFMRRFGVAPSAATHPKALRTVNDIKDALKSMGLKPVARVEAEPQPRDAKKDDWIDQLLEHDPKAKILDVIIDEWRGRGMVELPEEAVDKLILMVQLALRHPDMVKAFSGVGLSEVSVFWTDVNQVRQRARFDRIKPNASIDLKSFSNWQGRDFRKALLREAALRFYDLQAAHYDVARREAKRLAEEGLVHFCEEVLLSDAEVDALVKDQKLTERPAGAKKTVIRPADEDQLEFVRSILCTEAWEWIWVFYKTDGAPTAQVVRLDRQTKAFQRGVEFRESALASFLHYREMFDIENMWVRLDPLWTPDDEDWPFFMSADL